jgi:adenylate cyclase
MFGELVPKGGGDRIPLLKDHLVIGRRESCDIVLRFSNVSTNHCELELHQGYWFVTDLNSRNGTRVNGFRIHRKRIDPGDSLTFAKHVYQVEYSPKDLGATGIPPDDDIYDEIWSRSLLEGAGLNRKSRQVADGRVGRDSRGGGNRPDKPPR